MPVAEPYFSTPLPLKSRCIRLLRLLEAFDTIDGFTISADLEVFKLDVCPKFHAVSYVWASGLGQQRTIVCNGALVEVSENCFQALKHIMKTFGARRVWVDAICINQEDEKEKARQIPLMGSIYSGAESVYVWLGTGNATTNRVTTVLRTGEPSWAQQVTGNLGSTSVFNIVIWWIIIKACFQRQSWQLCHEPQSNPNRSEMPLETCQDRNSAYGSVHLDTADL